MLRDWKWAFPLLVAGLLLGASGCGGSGGSGKDDGSSKKSGAGDTESHAAPSSEQRLDRAAGGTVMADASGAQVSFAVHGMHCEGCVSTITKALQGREGVMAHQVILADSVAKITYDPNKVGPADLKLLIEDLGYTVAEKI